MGIFSSTIQCHLHVLRLFWWIVRTRLQTIRTRLAHRRSVLVKYWLSNGFFNFWFEEIYLPTIGHRGASRISDQNNVMSKLSKRDASNFVLNVLMCLHSCIIYVDVTLKRKEPLVSLWYDNKVDVQRSSEYIVFKNLIIFFVIFKYIKFFLEF